MGYFLFFSSTQSDFYTCPPGPVSDPRGTLSFCAAHGNTSLYCLPEPITVQSISQSTEIV